MDNLPIPTVTAMLLCDQIVVEHGTGKKTLVGIFELVGTASFPTAIPRISVYIRLVDGQGKYQFKLRLVSLKDEALVIPEIQGELAIADAAHAAEVVVNLLGVQLSSAGKYEFQFYVQEVYLHRATFEISQIGLPGGTLWQQPQP